MSLRSRGCTFRAELTGLAWISPWLIGFALFLLLPIVLSGYLSFCEFNGLRRPVFTGWENVRALLSDQLFWQALKNTALYAAVALPAGTLIALLLAVLLNVRVPGRTLWRALIFVPTVVPLVAVAIVWMWMYNSRFGLVNTALGWIGITGPNWLSDARWTMPSMILLSFWSVGNAVVIYLAGLQDVPRSLYEAAHVDGAGPVQRLCHVTLPMISPAIFFNVVLGIIFVWQVFAVPYIMIPNGGPGQNAYFYTMYLYDVAFLHQRFGYACLLSWIQLGIILLLTALAFRLSRNLVHYRGGLR
ncbi:MAG: sugar ABC transporter permease [Phycisphaerae bacterium]|nr:sugar ABC transporter permease [Phycisphaerae bacterium]